MEAAVTTPGYRFDRQGRVHGLMGAVMWQLRGEAFRAGNIPLCITDSGSIFIVSFQRMICKLYTDPANIWSLQLCFL